MTFCLQARRTATTSSLICVDCVAAACNPNSNTHTFVFFRSFDFDINRSLFVNTWTDRVLSCVSVCCSFRFRRCRCHFCIFGPKPMQQTDRQPASQPAKSVRAILSDVWTRAYGTQKNNPEKKIEVSETNLCVERPPRSMRCPFKCVYTILIHSTSLVCVFCVDALLLYIQTHFTRPQDTSIECASGFFSLYLATATLGDQRAQLVNFIILYKSFGAGLPENAMQMQQQQQPVRCCS